MLQNLITLAAFLAPPQESQAQDPAGTRSFAAALPASTLMVATVGEVEPHFGAWRGTVLYRLLQAAPIPPEARAGFAEFTSRARELTGLDEDQLFAVVMHGVTVALTRVDESNRPHAVLSARLVDAQVYAAALERAAPRLGLSHTGDHGGSALWTSGYRAFSRRSACTATA